MAASLIIIILGIFFSILGCKMAAKGNIWGIVIAFFGFLVATIVAIILYIQYDKNKKNEENINQALINTTGISDTPSSVAGTQTITSAFNNNLLANNKLNALELEIGNSSNKIDTLNNVLKPYINNIENYINIPNNVVCESLYIVMNLLLKYDKLILDSKYSTEMDIKTYFNYIFSNISTYNYENFNPKLLISIYKR